MRKAWEYWKSIKLTNYWHAEIIFIVPFLVWFVWRFETMIRLLEKIAG